MKRILIIASIVALGASGFGGFSLTRSAEAQTGTKNPTPIKARAQGADGTSFDVSATPVRKADPSMQTGVKAQGKMDAKADTVRDNTSTSNTDGTKNTGADRNKVMERGIHGRIEIAIKSLVAVHARLSQLGDRIEERMKKLSANGANVEASQNFLTAARADLSKAKTETENARSAYRAESAAMTTSTEVTIDVNASFPKTLAAVQAAKTALKSAHTNLVSAVRSLTNSRVDANATSNTVTPR